MIKNFAMNFELGNRNTILYLEIEVNVMRAIESADT